MRQRALADFELAKNQLTAWHRERGIAPEAHLYEHGDIGVDPNRVVYKCQACLTWFPVSATEPNACPRCGSAGSPRPSDSPSEASNVCEYTSAWGPCGYQRDCAACGVAVVLRDLEFALADIESRSYAIQFTHELEKTSALLNRARVEATRQRVLRDAAPKISSAMEVYMRGRAEHLEQTQAAVRAGYDRIRASGGTPWVIEPRPTEASYDDVLRRILDTGTNFGFVNPRASVHKARIDPDRALLGTLQGHLRVHSLSFGAIAKLIPDGEAGTAAQRARRVRDRLRSRLPV